MNLMIGTRILVDFQSLRYDKFPIYFISTSSLNMDYKIYGKQIKDVK